MADTGASPSNSSGSDSEESGAEEGNDVVGDSSVGPFAAMATATGFTASSMTGGAIGPAVWEFAAVFKHVHKRVARRCRVAALKAQLTALVAGAPSTAGPDNVAAENHRVAGALLTACYPPRRDAHHYLTTTLFDVYQALYAHPAPSSGDAEVAPGVGAGAGTGAGAGVEATTAQSARTTATLKDARLLFTASTCVASLSVVIRHLLRMLHPFARHVDFWKGRVEWPARDLLEEGPVHWWRGMQTVWHAWRGTGAAPRSTGSRGTVPGTHTAGRRRSSGTGGSRRGQRWYDAFDITPRSIAKVRALEELRQPLLYQLGRAQRSLLAFSSARTAGEIRTAIADAVATLREVLVPAAQKQRRGPTQIQDIFEMLAIQETGGVRRLWKLSLLEGSLNAKMWPLRQRSYLRRNWWRFAVAGAIAAYGGYKLYKNRNEIGDSWRKVVLSGKEFYQEHVVEPAKAIADELFHGEPLHIANEAALTDANDSLRRMMGDIARTLDPPMSPDKLAKIQADLDISFISKIYEQQIQRPVKNAVMGDLVQLMLIQIQSIKRELMLAMEAVDQLLVENQFNLQVMATVPAFMVVFSSAWLVRRLWVRFTRPTSTRDLRRIIRLTLRDVDRLLTLGHGGGGQREEATSLASRRFSQAARSVVRDIHVGHARARGVSGSSVSSAGSTAGGVGGFSPRMYGLPGSPAPTSPSALRAEQSFNGLAPSELGALVYLICRLKESLNSYRAHGVMTMGEWLRLDEDLRDLADWDLEPQQRAATVQRMRATHGFLLPSRPDAGLF